MCFQSLRPEYSVIQAAILKFNSSETMLLFTALIVTTLLPTGSFAIPAGLPSTEADALPKESVASAKAGHASQKSSGFSVWQHPGVVVSRSQLDFVKAKVAAKSQPWSSALSKMLTDEDKYGKYASAKRSSKAQATVKCGPTTNPDIGCTDERGDALAAWANALAGYISSDETHTKSAISLMNKWSSVIKGKFQLNGYFYYMRLAKFICRSLTGQCNLANSLGRCVVGESR